MRLDVSQSLGLELDALYQRIDYDSENINIVPETGYSYQSFEAVHSNRWQFPLLVQYRRAVRKVKLFVEAGPAISSIGNSKGSFSSTSVINLVSSTSTTSVSGGPDTRAGITGGLGVDAPMFHVHLRPEFRCSHWFQSTTTTGGVTVPGRLGNLLLETPGGAPPGDGRNEATFLLNLSF